MHSKHWQRCIRSVSEFNSVQLRVRAPILRRPQGLQSSQRSGRRHKPAGPRAALGTATILPPCSSLRVSFVKNSCRGSTDWSIQFLRSRSPTEETRRRERRQCKCESCREHHFTESKPQQTGTGLLIRHGEVATTSGSTNSKMPGRLISRTSPFEGDCGGANPSPAANQCPLAQNQSGSLTNCGRWRVTNTGYQSCR